LVFHFAIQNIKIKTYRTLILAVILCGYETWSLTLREECRLRVYENRVLRRIFGLKRDEVKREWRKLQGGSNTTGTCAACLHTNQSRSYLNHLVHNAELNDLYS
jgi:hypothetical protein